LSGSNPKAPGSAGGYLLTGGAAITAEINGQPRSLRLKFLNVWTKTPEGWKFVAWQSTSQPQ
jgi:hypothetical protein